MRFVTAVGGVAIVVALILIIQALYAGYRESALAFFEEVDADLWVGQAGTFDLFRSTSLLSPEVVENVATTQGVEFVGALRSRQARYFVDGEQSPTLFLSFARPLESQLVEILGIEQLPRPGELVVSDYANEYYDLSPGTQVELAGTPLTVVGNLSIKSPPYGSFSIINFEDASTLFEMDGKVSFLIVGLDGSRDAEAVAEDIRTRGLGLEVFTRDEFADQNGMLVTGFLPVISVILVFSYVVGTVITGLTIYTATVEKARDYGILKAIGARNSYVYGIVIYQSLAVSVIGFVVGLPLALGATVLAESRVPEFITVYEWPSAVITFGAVIAMGLIASVLPVHRITSIDPAVVFRA